MEAALSEGKFGAVLTVEGGAVLAGQLERVETIWNTAAENLPV